MRVRYEMKEAAKALMAGNAVALVLMTLAPAVVVIATVFIIPLCIGLFFSFVFYGSGVYAPIMSILSLLHVVLFIVGIIAGILTHLGVFATMVDFSRTGDEAVLTIKNMTRYLSDEGWQIFKVFFMQRFFLNLWAFIPIVGPFIAIVKGYSYSMSLYNFVTDANRANRFSTEYITLSRKKMFGFKQDLFVMDLSFILWTLLGFITFGLAFFWVGPYQTLTRIEFYKDIDALYKENLIAEGKTVI